MNSPEMSTAMRYVMTRIQLEAINLTQMEYPEHFLLAILKISELTADEVSTASKHIGDTTRDINLLREEFRKLHIDTKEARVRLRKILLSEPPTGDHDILNTLLLDRADERAKGGILYPSDLLHVMLDNPTPAMKAVLTPVETAGRKAGNPEEASLSFLAELTERIRTMRSGLLEKVHGQDHVVHAFAEGMFASEMLAFADENRKQPRAIFVFAGPPGVGKTFLAEQAAEALGKPFKRFDMTTYADSQAQMTLVGFAPSYKDAKEGLLTNFVKENPKAFLLFDEIEKAHLNVIHLFLQILDAGRLHDEFLDRDTDFRDTIIIFTTNAGRRLYEEAHNFNAAGLSRQTILNALETDTNPQTDRPFFPAAICSRLATGYPMMFNHLASHNLERISRTELLRCSGLFKKQYGISAGFDDLLPATLLFAEGGQADARTLRAQSELFFKSEIFKLCRLWDKNIEHALEKVREIYFAVDTEDLPDNVSALFENCEKPEVMVYGDALFAARLEAASHDILVHTALDREEAFSLITKTDISFVLLKLVNGNEPDFSPLETRMLFDEPIGAAGTMAAFDYTPMASSPLNDSRGFFKSMRERMPEIPIYLLENDDFAIDRELENAFIRVGARAKITVSASRIGECVEELKRISKGLHLQKAAASLAAERKILSFESAPISLGDKSEVTIRLRELTLRRSADANDASSILDEIERPKTRFSDVIGAEDAKDELRSIAQYFKNPKSFAAKGLRPPKGVLLYGPPGTGKTLLARAMAGESDAAFIPAAASEFVTKWQGSGPDAVRELFKKARRYAPSIVFIDEIDAIGRTRGSSGISGHGEEMALNALLTEMDGFSDDPKRPVFVLAATNFNVEEKKGGIGVIDPALSRRFDRRILVDLPTKDDRQRYLEYMLMKHEGNSVSASMIERLAGRTTGLSLASLETVIELAARNAVKRNLTLGDELLEEAFEVLRHGEEKKWGYRYLERVARHEAGHAYISYLGGKTPNYLTIIARSSHGGYIEYSDTEDSPLLTKEDLMLHIRVALGGRAAELVYYGDEHGISTGVRGDLESATRIARSMLVDYGMDKDFGLAFTSPEESEKGSLAGDIRNKVNEILREQMDRAASLIQEGKRKIDLLVAALIEKNKLNDEEINRLLG